MIKKYANTKKKEARGILDAMWVAFEEYGGYEYNDDMLSEIQGAEEAWSEYEKFNERDMEYNCLVEDFKQSIDYINHLASIVILKDTIPPAVYS